MRVKLLMLPLFLTGVLLVGCEDRTSSKSSDATTDAKAADAKAAVNKDAADAKAAADKAAADKAAANKAAADKAAANTKADADKAAANAKAAADKAAANTKADKVAAEAARDQASKLLVDLQTAVTDQKWTDAGALIKQLDAVRDRLAADQKARFDSLKTQYNDNQR